jgi:hypothetical protein
MTQLFIEAARLRPHRCDAESDAPPDPGIEQQVDFVMESFLPRRPRGAPEAICCGYGR